MKAVTKIFAGAAAVAVAAGGLAAPAAAQYYPGYPGQGYGTGGVIGAVIDQILGAQGYGQGQRYSQDRHLVERCIAAVTNRVERQYAGYGAYGSPYGSPYGAPYGAPYGNAYGYGQASPAQVLGVTSVDRRSNGLRVRGTATANAHAAAYGGQYGSPYGGAYGAPYGNAYGYGQARPVGELTFRCDVDYRGRVTNVDIDRNRNMQYGYPYRR